MSNFEKPFKLLKGDGLGPPRGRSRGRGGIRGWVDFDGQIDDQTSGLGADLSHAPGTETPVAEVEFIEGDVSVPGTWLEVSPQFDHQFDGPTLNFDHEFDHQNLPSLEFRPGVILRFFYARRPETSTLTSSREKPLLNQ